MQFQDKKVLQSILRKNEKGSIEGEEGKEEEREEGNKNQGKENYDDREGRVEEKEKLGLVRESCI